MTDTPTGSAPDQPSAQTVKPADELAIAVEGGDLIAAIDAEMEGRARGYADRRGELLFRCRDRLASQEGIKA